MKVGIYSGVFDPIHNGHLAFAEDVISRGLVDEVYFVIEEKPRRKENVTNSQTRKSILEVTIKDNPSLNIFDPGHATLSVADTLPLIHEQFPEAEVFLMMGSDLFDFVHTWDDFNSLRQGVNFIVSTRQSDQVKPDYLNAKDHVIPSRFLHLASSQVKRAIIDNKNIDNMVPESAREYIAAHNLYTS